MPGDEVTIHLVRHGQTPWNAEGRLQGQTPDVPLTEQGRAQAQAVADALAGRPIGAIIASDLVRAMETARPLANRLALPIETAVPMREKAFGGLEGMRVADLEPDLRAALDRQWHDPDLAVDGGESHRELYARVADYLDELLRDPPADEFVVVAHGGTVRVAILYLAGHPVEALTWTEVDNGSIHTVTVPRRST